MDQIKTGKFIAGLRKEKGLTQAQIAEMLNITDRAISKWETGKSMPDSSIMLELCDILGITVNELLSGERIEMKDFENKANENLLELKRNEERRYKLSTVLSIIYTTLLLVGIVVCVICNYAISRKLTWSLISVATIFYTWAITIPMIYHGKKGIRESLVSLSIFTLPFLYILSLLVNAKAVFSIGAVMAVVALAYVWLGFVLFIRFQDRKLFAGGALFLIFIVLGILINIVLSKMLDIPVFDIWDVLSVSIFLIGGLGLICGDICMNKAKRKSSESN